MSRTSEMIQSFVNVERVGMALLSNLHSAVMDLENKLF